MSFEILSKLNNLNPFNKVDDKEVEASKKSSDFIKIVDEESLSEDDLMGLAVEKTVKAEETNKVESKNNEKKVQKDGEVKASKSSARTLNEAMSKSYKNWDKMTVEEKEKKIIDHINAHNKEDFAWLATEENPDGRIGWLKSFLKNDKMSEDEVKVVVGALKQFNVSDDELAELQAQGVKMVFDEDNENREVGQMQVVEDMEHYGEKAQTIAVDKVSTSTFDSVKIAGSNKTSKLNDDVQTYAVEQFQKNSETSSEKVQKQIEQNLVNQYGEYAKENEVDIHKLMMQSKHQETLELASGNVYKFDKDNQQEAAQVTIDTDNEGALKALAATINRFHEDNQQAIKTSLSNTSYDSVKAEIKRQEALKAEQEAEELRKQEEAEQAEIEEQKALEEEKKFDQANAIEKSKLLAAMDEKTKKAKMINLVKTTPVALLKATISTQDAMKLLQENTSTDVKAKLYELVNSQSLQDQNKLVNFLSKQSDKTLSVEKNLFGNYLLNKVAEEKQKDSKAFEVMS